MSTYHNARAVQIENGKPTQSRFDNGMTAHAWAQLTQTFGASSNGNFYFEGRSLYSYGPHFVAGYILPRPGDDSHSRGIALINGDSSSVTTNGKHMPAARRAPRGASITVPGLTRLVREIERALCMSIESPEPGQPFPDVRNPEPGNPRPIAWGKFRDGLRKALVSHMESEGMAAAPMADLFRALGYDNPERRAATLAKRIAKAEAADKAARADAKRRKEESDAKQFSAIVQRYGAESFAEDVIEAARKAARSGASYRDYARKEQEAEGREISRAAKAARARGWTRIAADCMAAHKALRGALGEFEAAGRRAARVELWGKWNRAFCAALADLDNREADARTLTEGLHAGREICEALDSYAAAPARVAGFGPAALAYRVNVGMGDIEKALSRVQRRDKFRAARAEFARFRAGLAALAGEFDGTAAERLTAMERAEHAAWRYAPCNVFDGPPRAPIAELPGAWRVAGWTPDNVGDVLERLKAAKAEAQAAKRAEEAAARAEAERKAEALREEARTAWRNAEDGPRDANGRLVVVRTCPDGGAMLRAVNVARDDSGAIVGGDLETSQSARVPLTHALRVFRFLKLCRERGEAWHKNGRTIRVGIFQVDSVQPNGDFVAGCHMIKFAEVERLAAALGVADLAPADTREEGVHA